ncbi:MAG TPA: FtsQ-type POTRA domain-containing protein [Candidatus Baltobacteraceae bacterium]
MTAQKKSPQRRKPSPAARLRPFWILFAIVLVAAAGGAYYGATWPGFFPRTVRVIGNTSVPGGEILARAAIATDRNVWLQNTRAAARRVEAIPYVATARVRRSLPAGVTIEITQRVPYAVIAVASSGSRALVDHDLRVLSLDAPPSTLPIFALKRLPVVNAGVFLKIESVRQMRGDYDALLAGHVIVSRLSFDRFGDLQATTRAGVRILFGDRDELAKTIPLIDPILSQVSRSGRPIAAVDLRAPSTPVVVYRK